MNAKKDEYMRGYRDGVKDGTAGVLPAIKWIAEQPAPGTVGGLTNFAVAVRLVARQAVDRAEGRP